MNIDTYQTEAEILDQKINDGIKHLNAAGWAIFFGMVTAVSFTIAGICL